MTDTRPQYDARARRRAVRGGRQRGCSIYIAADELEAAGYDPAGPPPFYRVWGTARGGVFVRLYREP
jgi:hypothetical protein